MQRPCVFVEKRSISRNDIFSKFLNLLFLRFYLYPSYVQVLQTLLFSNYLELFLQYGKRKNGINRINFVTWKHRILPCQLHGLTAFIVRAVAFP